MMKLVTPDGVVIANYATEAQSTAERIGGWMFREKPCDDEALLIPGCALVHTCFMRFRLDIVFLDDDDRVLSIRSRIAPWRVSGCKGACSVLELAEGRAEASGISVGQRLVLTESIS